MKTIRYAVEQVKDKRPQESRELLVSLDVPVTNRGDGFTSIDRALDKLVAAVPGVEFPSSSLTYNFRVYVARLFDLEEVKAGVIGAVREWYATKHECEVEMVEADQPAAAR